jgi:hypothetical protein
MAITRMMAFLLTMVSPARVASLDAVRTALQLRRNLRNAK